MDEENAQVTELHPALAAPPRPAVAAVKALRDGIFLTILFALLISLIAIVATLLTPGPKTPHGNTLWAEWALTFGFTLTPLLSGMTWIKASGRLPTLKELATAATVYAAWICAFSLVVWVVNNSLGIS